MTVEDENNRFICFSSTNHCMSRQITSYDSSISSCAKEDLPTVCAVYKILTVDGTKSEGNVSHTLVGMYSSTF